MSKLKKCLQRSVFSEETKDKLSKVYDSHIKEGLSDNEATMKVVHGYHNELIERHNNLKQEISDKLKVKIPKETVKKEAPAKKIVTLEPNGKEKNTANGTKSSSGNNNETGTTSVPESVKKETQLRVGTKKANRKIKDPSYIMALRHEVFTPYDLALQHFIRGASLNYKTLSSFFKGDKTELNKRFSMTRKDAPSIEQTAHNLWEEHSNLNYDSQDWLNAVEEVINRFEHPSAMAVDLNRRMNKVNPEDFSPEEIELHKNLEKIDNERLKIDVENQIHELEVEPDPTLKELANDQQKFDEREELKDIIKNDGEEPAFEPKENYSKMLDSKSGISNFTPNESTQKYKSKEGEEISYNSIARESSNPEIPGLFEQESSPKNPDSGVDEVCWMERQMNVVPSMSLMGNSTIKSNSDVAYLFRHLEEAPSENVFAVFIKPDGTYNTLYVATGNTNASLVDVKLVYAAAKEFGASKVTFVHNHPSGNLTPSEADYGIHRNLTSIFNVAGIELTDSVIINLDSGKYTEFNSTSKAEKARPQSVSDETSVNVHQFNKQILYTPSNQKTKITSSLDVAKFLSTQKRGLVPKLGVIVLDRKNNINRYVMLDGQLSVNEIADSIMTNVGKSGEVVILVSNTNFKVGDIRTLNALIKPTGANILDAISVDPSEEIKGNYNSMLDDGVMENQDKYESPKKETIDKFKQSVDMLYKIKDTQGASKKRTLAEQRREFLEDNPSIKNIEDNIKSIFDQLQDLGDLKLEGDCF